MKNKIKKIIKWTILSVLLFFTIMIILSFFINVSNEVIQADNLFLDDFNLLNLDESRNYQKYPLETYKDTLNVSDRFISDDDYDGEVLEWLTDNEISFDIEVIHDGIFEVAFDYASLQKDVQDIQINIAIDDEEESNIVLPSSWSSLTDLNDHVYDIYQNEVNPTQTPLKIWRHYFLYDQRFYNSTPISFNLTKGMHKITIKRNVGAFLLGSVYLANKKVLDNYEVLKSHETHDQMIVLEGEHPYIKSQSDIAGSASQIEHLTPFSTSKNMINNLSGDTFNTSGKSVTYLFDVKQDGYYQIALKYYISQTNTSVYSKILIDNQILNQELNRYCFKNLLNNNGAKFQYETLNNGNDNILIYLTKGIHSLTIQLDASLQSPIYYELLALIDEMNELYLEVIKLTGGLTDKNKTWDIAKYIPDAKNRLNNWKDRLESLLELINQVSKSNPKKQNRLYQQVSNAYSKIIKLCNNPNELPHKLNLLVDGSASAALLLSNSLHTSTFNPLSIDKIYLYGEKISLPKIRNNVFKNMLATIQRVFRTSITDTTKDTVTVWVNRSTYYVSLMQQFVDAYYTPKTNIKVRFSLLPDESKLTYANASNTQPDAALGVSSSVPYSLGIRGALADLHQFETFGEVIKTMAPGALLQLIEGDKVYGIPETQDFQVTFYREDILNEFKIEVPQTYDDIIDIVPILQRYGMNYYMPLAGASGLKSLSVTAPFIYQYGADIYKGDYMSVAIDSEKAIDAFTMMVDLFALYSLPLTTQNFYNNFRSGLSPVGIAGFDTYLQLVNAAPEIVGKWHITLAPGVKDEDGNINRTQTGDGKTIIIFEKSKKKAEAWDFISWWMSTEVQSKFASDLQATYGPTYLWNTSNLEAFKTLAIDENDKAVILEQLNYLHQIPQTPATYMVERGISNIWNTCVFDQENLRAAITNYSIEINREIKRKMIEFKYLDSDGNILKPYIVPTIEDIKKWQTEVH